MIFEYVYRDWWQYCVALFLVMGLVFFLIPAAKKAELVDKPSLRKRQKQAIPLVGGLAIFFSWTLSLLLFEISLQEYRLFIFAAGILVMVGALDDYIEINPLSKIAAQFFVASILVFDGTVVRLMGDVLHSGQSLMMPEVSAYVFSVIAIVGLINAYNMLDGLDGLAAGSALISFIALLLTYTESGFSLAAENVVFLLLFATVILGFVPFNFKEVVGVDRQVFLGDAGSMVLGLSLAYITISWSQPDQTGRVFFSAAVAPWLVAVPLMDMLRVMVSRLFNRQRVFEARRDHVHHILLERGLHPLQALLLLLIVQACLAGFGVFAALSNINDWIIFWAMVPVMIVFSASVLLLKRPVRSPSGDL